MGKPASGETEPASPLNSTPREDSELLQRTGQLP